MKGINSKSSILDMLDIKAEEESQVLMKKNTFILKIINEIGSALDKNYQTIKEFDFEANIEDLFKLFDYFYSLCNQNEKSPDKHVALYFISTMITKINELDDNCQKIINQIMQIIYQDNYLKDKQKRTELMLNIINDFKPLLSEEKNKYIILYTKLFGLDIGTLLEILIHFLTSMDTGNEDILFFTLKALTKKYKKLIISNDILDSKEVKKSITIGSLNELLQKKLTNEQKIIVFEKSHFLIREPNTEELEAFINEDFSKKIKNYKYGNSIVDNDTNNSLKPLKISLDSLDINSLSPIEIYLLDQVNELNKNIKEHNKKLNDLTQENFRLRFKMSLMDKDLKKIQMRSLYKGIIDIFASICNVKIDDYYINKLNSILNCLDELTQTNIIIELKEFLLSIYAFLQKGNCLAHTNTENYSPLQKIFWLVEKEKKKTFPHAKKLLEDLSFNETLKYAENNYYSLKDKNKLLNNIKFSYEKLVELLSHQ